MTRLFNDLTVQQDIEVEVERFENTKGAVLKKYAMIERPEGKLEDKLNVAVDALCALCLGKYSHVRLC